MQLKKNLARGIKVDPQDLHFLRLHLFCISAAGYVIRRAGKDVIFLHKLILNIDGIVDHKDGDKLNCTRDNLRPATQVQNTRNMTKPSHNTSGFKGVSKNGKSWAASIHFNAEKIHIGTYPTRELAAKAYDEKAKTLFGDFARLNF